MTQVESLHVALQQSFSPDRHVRDPAEVSIKQLKFVPGATQMLIQIAQEKQVRKKYASMSFASVQIMLRGACYCNTCIM